MTAAYDAIAAEYYGEHHQTSRNFDAAAVEALDAMKVALGDGPVLEVGAGRGRSGEFLGLSASRVVQLDNSAAMLAIQPREKAAVRVLHDAEHLPFPDQEFSAVLAFLCDPFLGLNFLSEARRVLTTGGILLATTPAYEWGKPLRDRIELDTMVTRFVLRDGTHIEAPSALYSPEQLRSMLGRVQFQHHKTYIRTHWLPPGTTPVSPDILMPAAELGISEYELPILYTLLAER
jgi:SAM-dependent methyltransferase